MIDRTQVQWKERDGCFAAMMKHNFHQSGYVVPVLSCTEAPAKHPQLANHESNFLFSDLFPYFFCDRV
jgi:hypothetical protein